MNGSERVRVGIIGPSWWVNYWHLPAIQNHPHAEIAAVCGANARDAAEVQAKYGASAQAYTDMEAMLESVPLDGVVVCTPNDMHHPATMAALRHNLHVTCEKPVALNATQAREMAETAKAKGLIGMTNFPYRDNPAVQTFRRLIAEGYVGTPLHVYGAYHGGYGIHRPPGWRGQRARSSAGILDDLGSHLIDLVRYLTGDEFRAVCASALTLKPDDHRDEQNLTLLRTHDPRAGARNDDSCAFLAEFGRGMQGLLHASWVAYQGAGSQYQNVEVSGTAGRLHWTATHAGNLLRGLRVGDKHWETIPVEGTVAPDPAQEGNEDFFRPGRHTPTNTTYRWLEAIRTGQAGVSPSLEDGWRAQQVIDAVMQAAAERCWIPIESE